MKPEIRAPKSGDNRSTGMTSECCRHNLATDSGGSTPVCGLEHTLSIATRWTTKVPSFVKAIGFPGDWSQAKAVNDRGIAVGKYGSLADGSDLAYAAAIRWVEHRRLAIYVVLNPALTSRKGRTTRIDTRSFPRHTVGMKRTTTMD
jgi:hypothetical protein